MTPPNDQLALLVQLDADAAKQESFYVSQLSAESTQPREVQELEKFWTHSAPASGSKIGLSTGEVGPECHLRCLLQGSQVETLIGESFPAARGAVPCDLARQSFAGKAQ